MVNVLPEPVTPSSVWCLSPLSMPTTQLVDRLRLIARRFEVRNELELSHGRNQIIIL